MTYIPPKKFTTDKLPTTGNDGDTAFHDTLKKPLYWNNGWHQTGDDSYVGPIDLFLIAGQSNAHGHADVSGLDDNQIVTNDVFFYTSWHYNTSNASTDQYYIDWSADVVAGETTGTIDTIPIDNTKFGPEVGFARRAKELSSTKNRIGILKYAVGASQLTADQDGTNDTYSDWDLTATGDREGDALRGWKLAVTDGLDKLTAAGLTYNIKGLIWWQGESGGALDDYKSLFTHMRDYLNKPNLPIIVTIINYGEAIRNKYIQLATDDDYIENVDAGEFGHMEFGGNPNHVGAISEGGTPKDMFNIGMEYANVFASMFGESPIPKLDQTITFPSQPSRDLSAGTHTINNVFTSSGLDVVFTSSDTSLATISGNVVTLLAPGTVTITATQAGNNSYNSATTTQTLEITSGLWSPEYDSGVVGWWDASDTSTITTDVDGVTVTAWNDKTSNNAHFTNTVGTSPELDTEVVDGSSLTTIHMSDDEFRTGYLSTAQKETLGLTNDTTKQTDVIWYFVGRVDASVAQTTSNNEAMFAFQGTVDGATPSEQRQFILLNTNDSAQNNLFWYNTANASPNFVQQHYYTRSATYPAATSPDWFQTTLQLDMPGGVANTWTDGNAITTNASVIPQPDKNAYLRLNKYQKTLEGEWGEIIASTSTALEDRQKIEGYLAHKWGTTSRLPTDHPYKSFAPGESPWTPSSLNTLVWLDASDETSVTHSSNAVSQWSDKSGNNYHFTQSTATNNPTTNSSTIGGLNALDFDGSDITSQADYLQNTSVPFSGTHSIFVVMLARSADTDYTRVLENSNGFVFGLGSGNTDFMTIYRPAPTSAWNDLDTNTPTQSVLNAGIYGVTNDNSTATPYVNGTAQNTKNGNMTVNMTGGMNLGAWTGGDQAFDGLIGEIIITPNVLSSAYRQKVEGYLAHKWGLTAELPADHPYKSLAPAGESWSPVALNTISWHDVSDSDTVVETTGVVTTIEDKTGNGLDLVANSSSTNNHALQTASQNNLDVVSLDGNDYYELSNYPLPADGNFSISVACEVTQIDNIHDAVFAMNSSSRDFQVEDGANAPNGEWRGKINSTAGSSSAANGATSGFMILSFVADLDSNELSIHINGTKLTETILTSYTTAFDTVQHFTVFTNRAKNAYPAGKIGEIVVATETSSDTIDKIHGYLAHKWGTQDALPSDHAYKTSAP